MKKVISVRFKENGKSYYFDPAGADIKTGDYVIVETARGIECGEVVQGVKEIADAGVRVLFYDRGFNHSKLLVSDDLLATIGSTNVDFRSFEHDFESNVFFYDQAMALRVKQVFLDDEADSIPLDQLREGASRGLLLRLWESLVRLMSPLM